MFPAIFANYVANTLTLLSLACGFVSIIFSLEEHFTFACWAIILAVVFDGFDGKVARKNPLPSEFGKELDSLSDVVSFGIAPSSLGYFFICSRFEITATLVLFIYLACSAWRLAKYNISVNGKMKNCFSGLPTTASGGVLASFILVYKRYTQLPPKPGLYLILVLILAYLMISKTKFPNFDGIKKIFSSSMVYPVFAVSISVFAIILFYFFTGVVLPEILIFMFFLQYLTFSPFLIEKFV